LSGANGLVPARVRRTTAMSRSSSGTKTTAATTINGVTSASAPVAPVVE
jgi:hypothetical protein